VHGTRAAEGVGDVLQCERGQDKVVQESYRDRRTSTAIVMNTNQACVQSKRRVDPVHPAREQDNQLVETWNH
jgi:hypothetical protein